MSTRKFALAVIASALGLSVCGDPQGLLASVATVSDAYTVYALSGTAATLPSGINTYLRAAVRVDGSANFDVALDLDSIGRVIVYPVQKVVSSLAGTRSVGLKKVTGPFSAVTIAPTPLRAHEPSASGRGRVLQGFSRRGGEGIEPSKRRAATPCRL